MSNASTLGNTGTSPKTKTTHLPLFSVVLVNDNVNFAENVARAVNKLTPLDKIISLEKAIEAHEKGRSFLLSTHKERAELYKDQFASHVPPIVVEIEPAAS